jgi:hypothetical protein
MGANFPQDPRVATVNWDLLSKTVPGFYREDLARDIAANTALHVSPLDGDAYHGLQIRGQCFCANVGAVLHLRINDANFTNSDWVRHRAWRTAAAAVVHDVVNQTFNGVLTGFPLATADFNSVDVIFDALVWTRRSSHWRHCLSHVMSINGAGETMEHSSWSSWRDTTTPIRQVSFFAAGAPVSDLDYVIQSFGSTVPR